MPEYSSSDLLGITGLVVGLIGIILSVFFYFCSKNKKILEYQVTSTKLITKDVADIPDLRIIVGNEPATSLTSTTVRFINNGNQTITSSDFASLSPLQITVSEHIFNIYKSCIKTTNKALNPSIDVNGKDTIIIRFEYLKPKQEFEITVLHDGELFVDGELTSGSLQCYDSALRDSRHEHIPTKAPLLFAIATGIIIITLYLFIETTNRSSDRLTQMTQQIYMLQNNIDELNVTIADLEHENIQLREYLSSIMNETILGNNFPITSDIN